MDETPDNAQALTTIVTGTPGDLAVAGWLDQHKGSQKTHTAYRDTITRYRAALQRIGHDLDSDVRTLALVAQAFASHSQRKERASKRTINQRLAILSSFFQYAMKLRLLLPLDDSGQALNPISILDRERVQAYLGGAQPLDREDVAARLAAIDQATKRGARDYALLAVLLDTTWRVSEVAGLRWRNVAISKSKGVATLTYDHAKEDERIIAELSKATTGALLRWLSAYYGAELGKLAPETPLWVSLAHDKSYGQQLGKLSIANVCQKYLGVSQVHATRHTAAVALEDAGAPLSYIQKRLNHKNAATTSIYLERKRRGENKYGDAVAAMFGIE
jgi:integrase